LLRKASTTPAIDPRVLRQCGLFAGHGDEELADICQYMRPLHAKAGARLFTQGEAAEGLYVVQEGQVRIVSRLPGDRMVELGRIGPGELFGEVALVIHSQHSTTAEVTRAFKGCFFSRAHFDMLRSDLRPSAFRTMNAITETVCGRIRAQIAELRESLPPGRAPAPARRPASRRPPERAPDGQAGDVFAPEQLRRLPLFGAYTAAELRALVEPLRARHLPRGETLIAPGAKPRRCLLVVRGALRLGVQRGAAGEQAGILGPSQMAGQLALMDGKPEPLLCETRETADVLELSGARFRALRAAADPLAFKFFETVNQSLVTQLRRNNRLLALLAVQGRLTHRARQST
jgi:CRP-like cAMP-binding protein